MCLRGAGIYALLQNNLKTTVYLVIKAKNTINIPALVERLDEDWHYDASRNALVGKDGLTLLLSEASAFSCSATCRVDGNGKLRGFVFDEAQFEENLTSPIKTLKQMLTRLENVLSLNLTARKYAANNVQLGETLLETLTREPALQTHLEISLSTLELRFGYKNVMHALFSLNLWQPLMRLNPYSTLERLPMPTHARPQFFPSRAPSYQRLKRALQFRALVDQSTAALSMPSHLEDLCKQLEAAQPDGHLRLMGSAVFERIFHLRPNDYDFDFMGAKNHYFAQEVLDKLMNQRDCAYTLSYNYHNIGFNAFFAIELTDKKSGKFIKVDLKVYNPNSKIERELDFNLGALEALKDDNGQWQYTGPENAMQAIADKRIIAMADVAEIFTKNPSALLRLMKYKIKNPDFSISDDITEYLATKQADIIIALKSSEPARSRFAYRFQKYLRRFNRCGNALESIIKTLRALHMWQALTGLNEQASEQLCLYYRQLIRHENVDKSHYLTFLALAYRKVCHEQHLKPIFLDHIYQHRFMQGELQKMSVQIKANAIDLKCFIEAELTPSGGIPATASSAGGFSGYRH